MPLGFVDGLAEDGSQSLASAPSGAFSRNRVHWKTMFIGKIKEFNLGHDKCEIMPMRHLKDKPGAHRGEGGRN